MKVSSGLCSLDEREFGSYSSKYYMSNKMEYFEELSEMEEFKFMIDYKIHTWKSHDIKSLYDKYGQKEIKENKK